MYTYNANNSDFNLSAFPFIFSIPCTYGILFFKKIFPRFFENTLNISMKITNISHEAFRIDFTCENLFKMANSIFR